MGAGIHGGFGNTAGYLETTYSGEATCETSYSERGIELPDNIRTALSKLSSKGDYISTLNNDFSMKDVSAMSKETGVEFAKVSIGHKTYLIRGDKHGTDIPDSLMKEIKTSGGTLDFHSHPHNDDCIPSLQDRAIMKALKKSTGQTISTIVTPNGKTSLFNEHGVISTDTVHNTIDDELKKVYLEMFGGK